MHDQDGNGHDVADICEPLFHVVGVIGSYDAAIDLVGQDDGVLGCLDGGDLVANIKLICLICRTILPFIYENIFALLNFNF